MDKRAIGVFDSGLGGLTAVRRLHALMPQENICLLYTSGRLQSRRSCGFYPQCPMMQPERKNLYNMKSFLLTKEPI